MRKLIPLLVLSIVAVSVFLLDDYAFTEDAKSALEEAWKGLEGVEVYPLEMRLRAVKMEDAGESARQEYIDCLWSSSTVIWNPDSASCDITVETIDALCNPVGGILTTAQAFYRANASKVSDYYVLGDIYWGYVPGLPTGWCWILMVDWTFTGIPILPGVFWFDRAAAYNHGYTIPPIMGYCGWPLSEPPNPFPIHCP